MGWYPYLIFFISGAVALIFETLWFRLAELIFGNSVWSAALVLSGFMAGLALGNFLVARYGHKINRPLFFYAALEIMIGVSGMSLVLFLPSLQELLIPVFRPFLENPLILNPIRLSFVFILLLIPTMAMGATLPIMVKSIITIDKDYGSVLGKLYGINTLGAVTGALLCEIIFIFWFGIKNSGLIAASLNLLAAMMAIRIAPNIDKLILPDRSKKTENNINFLSVIKNRRLLSAAFLSGAILLSLEVIWFRFLQLFEFGTSLIFAVMLAIVLAGISTGGFITSIFYRKRIHITNFIKEFALIGGILTAATYIFFNYIYIKVLSINLPHYMTFIIYSLFLMFPVSMISGILFTTLGRAIKNDHMSETGATGLLTLANTTGAMSGALISGFLLLPLAGMEKSFFILALCYGLIVLLIPKKYSTRSQGILKPVYMASVVYLFILILFPFGMMNEIYFQKVIDKQASRITDIREGLVATNFYAQYDFFDMPYYTRLITNGHSMSASDLRSKRYMKYFVYWPVAIHPDISNALLISYGVGSTAKALVDTQSIDSIDIVDISRDVLEMSHALYPDPDDYPLNDERVHTHIEDGRFFLRTTDRLYDLITAEPPPPTAAHVVNLYSQEYFQLLYNQLNEGGITTYWLPVHILKTTDSKSIIKAFCNVFNDCSLWSGAGLDWVLIGTKNITDTVPIEHLSKQWHTPAVAEELRLLGFENIAQFGATFLADKNHLQFLTKDSLPVTDNYPLRISPKGIQHRFNSSPYYSIMNEQSARERFEQSEFIDRIWPDTLKKETLDYFKYQRMVNVRFMPPDYQRKSDYDLDVLHQVLTSTSLSTLPLWIMGTNGQEQSIIDHLSRESPYAAEIPIYLARRALANRDFKSAIENIKIYMKSDTVKEIPQAHTLYIYALCMTGKFKEAADFLIDITQSFPANDQNMRFISWLEDNFDLVFPEIYRQ